MVKRVLVLAFLLSTLTVVAQNAFSTEAQCGNILEGEFLQNAERHEYIIEMEPGDVLQITGTPLGETLQFTILIIGPTGQGISTSQVNGYVRPTPQVESPVLSARGRYKIWVSNTQILYSGSITSRFSDLFGGVGIYTLFIACTKRDGTVINPGESETTDQTTPEKDTSVVTTVGDALAASNSPIAPSFSGVGFPGLQPVDFTQGVTIPFTLGTPNTGSISDGFVGIFGYTFTANAGDVFDLSFERLSGNLNLGLAVLSEQNEIAFQASLVTSSSLSTRFTLPSPGEYTIGVFRIELLPPSTPEATTFQITGAINP